MVVALGLVAQKLLFGVWFDSTALRIKKSNRPVGFFDCEKTMIINYL